MNQTEPCLHTLFAFCRSKGQKVKQCLEKTSQWFHNVSMLREEIKKKISLHGGRAGSRRGLVGQSRGLLIYTFHKIIHVRGIPLPIWLVRTRGGRGVYGVRSKKQSNNDVASFPYMQISGRPLTGEDCLIQLKRSSDKLSVSDSR